MDKNIPNKNNPLFNKMSGLSFDNIDDSEVLKLTDTQKADAFLAKYMKIFHPITEYKNYFNNSAKPKELIFKEIKKFYKELVIKKGWTEKKYIIVMNDIFKNNIPFSMFSLDKRGLFFERKNNRIEKRRR